MKIEVHNRCSDFKSYRAARVKSLFNAESGCNFDLIADIPHEERQWQIGLVVGPSGSGKTSLGRSFFGASALFAPQWPDNKPIVDAIAPAGDFDQVTAALAAVGLGTVPAWLRPYQVLSNGEKFRANLARVICEAPKRVVIDEFSSVVDRQIARLGALAFQKAWRRTGGQCVLLSCHYDIVDWIEPDWVFDTAACKFSGGRLWRRPKFELRIWQTDWRYWPLFEPHHYLKMPHMIAATNYVGTVDGELVCHVAFGTRPGMREARACRLVVMPEWQGAGVGMRFLNALCEMWLCGKNRYGKRLQTLFRTSHPGLAAALRRDPKWAQISAVLFGGNKARSCETLRRASKRGLCASGGGSGFGGHFRAVQGFRYYGEHQ
jgi:GNAT superfamily N-acetyltransferase